MGYLGYYFAWMLLSYGLRQPWLLAGLVLLWLLRGFIPTPRALFGAVGRARRLRQQVQVNRANITARRDLATIYLDLLRPRRALALLEEGLTLAPNDPELLYLSGLALHRAGQHEAALERLLRAVDKDHRLRHGEPYLVAGDALLALRRWDDAVDGYERFIDFNSSHVGVHTQLARAQVGAGRAAEARPALLAGLATWHQLPGSMKRKQFGAYLRAQWARVTVLKQPGAIAIALLSVVVLGRAGYASYPWLLEKWQGWGRDDFEHRLLAANERVQRSRGQCGKHRTGDFEGRYDASPELTLDLRPDPTRDSHELEQENAAWLEEQKLRYRDFQITPDRIAYGATPREELCLTHVSERSASVLRGEALLQWQGASGAVLARFSLRREGELVRLDYSLALEEAQSASVVLRRKP
jgi:tetratricopeptide (TPR) repeat protein